MTRREETFTLPGCSTWVFANAGATGYYREGLQPEVVRALAGNAETKLTPGERLAIEADIWASIGVGREAIGDYLAFAEGLQADRNQAVIDEVLGGINFIDRHLVNDTDRDSYRAWVGQYLAPLTKEVGWEPKPGESDEQKALRARLFGTLGYDARDPQVLAEARRIADKALADPSSVDRQFAGQAFRLSALTGDREFYDKVMAAMKNPKSPEEYYTYFGTLTQFGDPKLIERTLNYAISPEVRSQDALQLVTGVLRNPAGEKLAWDFIRERWPEIEKAGGPFASAEVVGATSVFCEAELRDQVKEFFTAHKVEAFERTYRQTVERINTCVDFKAQQESQLASWLGQHSASGGK